MDFPRRPRAPGGPRGGPGGAPEPPRGPHAILAQASSRLLLVTPIWRPPLEVQGSLGGSQKTSPWPTGGFWGRPEASAPPEAPPPPGHVLGRLGRLQRPGRLQGGPGCATYHYRVHCCKRLSAGVPAPLKLLVAERRSLCRSRRGLGFPWAGNRLCPEMVQISFVKTARGLVLRAVIFQPCAVPGGGTGFGI